MVDGRLTRINRKSGKPGVRPELWRSLSVKRRAELDSAFQLTGRGVYAQADEARPRFPKVVFDKEVSRRKP
eukprot:12857712-Prorocentrum_lima.AAC.1